MDTEYDNFKNHIRELGYDINIEDYPLLARSVKYFAENHDIKGLEAYMKQIQNCGGYALQIPICIFSNMTSTSEYTFEQQVLRIMELYPFVRLLSDTELKDNEYIVKFRSGKTGHHFIRIDKDGTITEKCEANPPQKFQNWRNLEDSPEAVFAVVKQEFRDEQTKRLPQCNKIMHLNEDAYYETDEKGESYVNWKKADKPQTFIDILMSNYISRNNSFQYNDKTFSFKVDKEEPEIVYICDDSQILGQFYTDGKDFIIDLDKQKENYIYGFQPYGPNEIEKSKVEEGPEI